MNFFYNFFIFFGGEDLYMEKEIKSPNHSTIIKDIITTYIHEHKLNNTCILSKKAMFDDLKKSNADFDICLSSFYSHLNLSLIHI